MNFVRTAFEVFSHLRLKLLIRLEQLCEWLFVSSKVPYLANAYTAFIFHHMASYPCRMSRVALLRECVCGEFDAIFKDNQILTWEFTT